MPSFFTTGSGCCCTNPNFVILIWNSNSAVDDNFDVYLNGTFLGNIDNSASGQTGRIFSTNTAITPSNIGTVLGINNLQSTIELNPALLITGTNTLKLVISQSNFNGDFGSIVAGQYVYELINVNLWDTLATAWNYNVTDFSLGGAVGSYAEYTFTYP